MIKTKIKYNGDILADYKKIIEEKSKAARGPILQLLRECTEANTSHRQENTGRLSSSWNVKSESGFNFTCVNATFYAFWFFYGRGPVRPVHARRLHYYINGAEIYSQYSRPTAPALPKFLNQFESGLARVINAR
jgi:hypothetical protein